MHADQRIHEAVLLNRFHEVLKVRLRHIAEDAGEFMPFECPSVDKLSIQDDNR